MVEGTSSAADLALFSRRHQGGGSKALRADPRVDVEGEAGRFWPNTARPLCEAFPGDTGHRPATGGVRVFTGWGKATAASGRQRGRCRVSVHPSTPGL